VTAVFRSPGSIDRRSGLRIQPLLVFCFRFHVACCMFRKLGRSRNGFWCFDENGLLAVGQIRLWLSHKVFSSWRGASHPCAHNASGRFCHHPHRSRRWLENGERYSSMRHACPRERAAPPAATLPPLPPSSVTFSPVRAVAASARWRACHSWFLNAGRACARPIVHSWPPSSPGSSERDPRPNGALETSPGFGDPHGGLPRAAHTQRHRSFLHHRRLSRADESDGCVGCTHCSGRALHSLGLWFARKRCKPGFCMFI